MKHSGDSSEQQMKWPESMKAMAIASNILIAGASSRSPVIYRFNKEKYNELKAKGLSLEF
ncbi:MAG: hypothetical protein Q4D10_08230 [Bacteroidales bacterium]|nr:hypothetical protein [Bacteroidales bacterium]